MNVRPVDHVLLRKARRYVRRVAALGRTACCDALIFHRRGQPAFCMTCCRNLT